MRTGSRSCPPWTSSTVLPSPGCRSPTPSTRCPGCPGRIGQLGLFREQGACHHLGDDRAEGRHPQPASETTAPCDQDAPAIQEPAQQAKGVLPGRAAHRARATLILADRGAERSRLRLGEHAGRRSGGGEPAHDRDGRARWTPPLMHLRIGAIKGQILDADGSAVLRLFNEFGAWPGHTVPTSDTGQRQSGCVRSTKKLSTTSEERSRMSSGCPAQ